jgi:hypothetical protein
MKKLILTLVLSLTTLFTYCQNVLTRLPGNPSGGQLIMNGNSSTIYEYFYNAQNLIDSNTVLQNNVPYSRYSNKFDSQGRIIKRIDHNVARPGVQTWTYSTNKDTYVQVYKGTINKSITTTYIYSNGKITSTNVKNDLTGKSVLYFNQQWRNFNKRELLTESCIQNNSYTNIIYSYDTISSTDNSIIITTQQRVITQTANDTIIDGEVTTGNIITIDTTWNDVSRISTYFNVNLPVHIKTEYKNEDNEFYVESDNHKFYNNGNIMKDSTSYSYGGTVVINYLYAQNAHRESLDNKIFTYSFNLYPNPAEVNGRITLTGLSSNHKIIKIMNSLGVVVYTIESDANEIIIDRELLSGIYKVNIYEEKKLVQSKNVVIK